MPPYPPSRVYPESYGRGRQYHGNHPPPYHYNQAPPSPPGSAPPPEYSPPTWYERQPSYDSRDSLWQPPLAEPHAHSAPRQRDGRGAHPFPLRRRYVHHVTEQPPSPREPWSVPKPKALDKSDEALLKNDEGEQEEENTASSKDDDKEHDGRLSLLAKVSTSMVPPHKRKQNQQMQKRKEEEKEAVESPGQERASLSPQISRIGATSPIQPKASHRHHSSMKSPYNMTNVRPRSAKAMPKPITPTGPTGNHPPIYPNRPPPYDAGPYGGPPAYPTMDERASRYYGPSAQSRGNYPPGPHGNYFPMGGAYPPHHPSDPMRPESFDSAGSEQGFYPRHPVVVERNSFDSADNNTVGSAPRFEGEGYWQPPPIPSVSPYRPRFEMAVGAGPYPPTPRWPYEGMPPHGHTMYPPHHPPYSEEYPLEPERYGAPSRPFAPYTYVQQPNLNSKTILRKKFSWKHYPELERFLIENREDYLEHSSRNYTVAQKQFNNMLTERLLEVADNAGYAFDQEDFNFVAIRDRIRCYYKSYVQTVRKRGLPLPGVLNKKKKSKTEDTSETQTEVSTNKDEEETSDSKEKTQGDKA